MPAQSIVWPILALVIVSLAVAATVIFNGPTATPTPTPTATATATGACIVDPTETAVPYPADGTDTSNGATSNALTVSGVVCSDVRPSFVSSATVAGR